MAEPRTADITVLRNIPQDVAQLLSSSKAGEHFFRELGLSATGTLCSIEQGAAMVDRAKREGLVVEDLTGEDDTRAA